MFGSVVDRQDERDGLGQFIGRVLPIGFTMSRAWTFGAHSIKPARMGGLLEVGAMAGAFAIRGNQLYSLCSGICRFWVNLPDNTNKQCLYP